MSLPVLWTSALAASLVLFAHPYLTYRYSLTMFRRHPYACLGSGSTNGEEFSLLFCAYNEMASLETKTSNLQELLRRYPKLEVLVYDDGSTDGTSELLTQLHSSSVRVVVGEGRQGKAHGMKLLASLSSRPFLIFTDANVLLDLEAIDQLADLYADSSVGGVCGTLRYLASDEPTSAEVSGGFYWRLEEKIKKLESRSGNVMGADGSIFSVRSSLYPDFPDTVQDDFTVSMAVIFAGKRLVKSEHVIAYERLVASSGDEARRKIRIATRALHTHKYLRPGLRRMSFADKYKYFSHKILRWWGGLFLLSATVSAVLLILSLGSSAIVASMAITIAGLLTVWAKPPIISLVWELLLAVFATLWGAIRGARGITMATWTPPSTR